MSPDDKVRLRRELRRRRKALTRDERRRAETALVRHAMRLVRRNKRIGAYLAAGSELDLAPLIRRARRLGAVVHLPAIPRQGRRLWFTRVGDDASRWRLHPRFGIREYDGPRCRAERLDVLLIPLLGVDRDGFRLGQGGGFYDATLAFRRRRALVRRPLLIGIAFDCQCVEQVPRDPWDVALDGVLTPSGLRRF
ncbi:5-formyltetrahydrofolate cyclo-ligase [Paludibacterium paludis]|uniref:5-formyltetrahydrofolate cyclo-ligase n=1 Tax=Paludibacterium paludis TaxID=1225769 RepID=UPI001C045678|nr:5-formyltetrahydrofolate cyclo-ligase [Paludibacterium paludis]